MKAIPIGTGLSSTLLSSQRTTTHRNPNPPSREPDLGALVQHYSRVSPASNRGYPNCVANVARPPAFPGRRRSRVHFVGVWQDGRCGSLRSPVSLPARRTLQAGLRSTKSPPCDAAHSPGGTPGRVEYAAKSRKTPAQGHARERARARAERPGKVETSGRAEMSGRAERPGRAETSSRAQKPGRAKSPDQSAEAPQSARAGRAEWPDRARRTRKARLAQSAAAAQNARDPQSGSWPDSGDRAKCKKPRKARQAREP